MPTTVPKLPKKWKDAKVVPDKSTSEAEVKAVYTLAKLTRSAKTLKEAELLKQKYGNWLAFTTAGPSKNAAKEKIAPVVVALFNSVVSQINVNDLPQGKYEVRLVSYTKPKFMHNATAAGKLPVWTFEYYDIGQPKSTTSFNIEMTRQMEGDENSQASQMADAAIAFVKKQTKASSVKIVKS